MRPVYRVPRLEDIDLYEILSALGDPIRLRIAQLLIDGSETTCSPLARQLGIAQSTLSHHLRQMREAGLTRTRPEGLHRWTSLRSEELDERFPGLLAVLADAERKPAVATPRPKAVAVREAGGVGTKS